MFLGDYFLGAWRSTGRAEGGYVDNPKDRGGPTHHGITEQVARANGYTGDMRDLTRQQAEAIAKAQYWDVLRLDLIAEVAPAVAGEVFDTGFLCGQATAARMLQRVLNLLNREARDYPDMTVDGLIGPLTVTALRAYLDKRGVTDGTKTVLKALNGEQYTYLAALTTRDPTQEEFFNGWLARV